MHVRVFRAQREEHTFPTKRVLKIGSKTKYSKIIALRAKAAPKSTPKASFRLLTPSGAPKKQPEAQNRSEKDTQSALRVPHVDVPEVSAKFRGCPGRFEIG